MIVVSVGLPSDALSVPTILLQFLLPWTWGYLFKDAPAKCSHCSLPWMWGSSSQLPPLTLDTGYLLSAVTSDLGRGVAPLGHFCDENRELPDVQTGFRKGRGTREQIAKHPLDH